MAYRILKNRGFTLFELLIVIFIIGLLASIVIVGGLGSERGSLIKSDAQRLALALKLVRRESLSSNETWGLFVSDNSYAFARYDEEDMKWYQVETGEFAPRNILSDVRLRITLEALKQQTLSRQKGTLEDEVVSGRNDTQRNLPDILIYASGEQTAFEIELIPNWDGVSWIVKSDGIEDAKAQISMPSQGLL